jgi:hypothetical protein
LERGKRGIARAERGEQASQSAMPMPIAESPSNGPASQGFKGSYATNARSLGLAIAYLRSSASNCDSTTDRGAATNYCGTTISNRPATNYGGAAITNRPARRNATSTVYAPRANDCARFYSAHNDKTCDQAEDYDRALHVLSLRVDFHCAKRMSQERSQVCKCGETLESGQLPTSICGFSRVHAAHNARH